MYPDISDAYSTTYERENLNLIINLNFIIFCRLNVILNSNFAAHRWRCKHQKYLDTLYVLKLRLRSLLPQAKQHKQNGREILNYLKMSASPPTIPQTLHKYLFSLVAIALSVPSDPPVLAPAPWERRSDIPCHIHLQLRPRFNSVRLLIGRLK